MSESLAALNRAAHATRAGAALLRWCAACAAGFAALLSISVILSAYERGNAADPVATSASAYLDFDLTVLRVLAESRTDLRAVWAQRPDWQLPSAAPTPLRLVPVRDAWAAVTSDRSHFRTAARGVGDALSLLLAALALALVSAAAAAAWKHRIVLALALLPLWTMLDPAAFFERTRTLGSGLVAALFVAAFAGALSGAALRARNSATPRLAAADAVQWLVPMVPALATAALFVCAKADQDPAAHGTASGLGALIRAAMAESATADRLASCALLACALALLSFLGHRFVVEVRSALIAGEPR